MGADPGGPVGVRGPAGSPLDEDLYLSAIATNHRNRSLAQFLYAGGALAIYPDEAVELYTRQSCVAVTAEDLAAMGATLADGGVHPRTGERVVDLATCRATLTTMLVAGMYETSGDWLYDVGLPGKSGIGGGMVTVSPGKGALGTFSPPLDAAGNSVRGTRTAAYLSRTLGMDILASAPSPPAPTELTLTAREQPSDEVAAAAHADLVEHGLEVVLHGVRGDVQRVGDRLGRRRRAARAGRRRARVR